MHERGTLTPTRQAAPPDEEERLLRLIPDDVRIVTHEWMQYYVDLPEGASGPRENYQMQTVDGWKLPSDLRPVGLPDYNLDNVSCAFLCSSVQRRGIEVYNGPSIVVSIQLPVVSTIGERDKDETKRPHYLWQFAAERNAFSGHFEIPYGLAIACDEDWEIQLSDTARGLAQFNFYMMGLQVWYAVAAEKKPDPHQSPEPGAPS